MNVSAKAEITVTVVISGEEAAMLRSVLMSANHANAARLSSFSDSEVEAFTNALDNELGDALDTVYEP